MLEKKNYENNCSRLENGINKFIENSNSLGFSFDDSFCITEVIPKSPAQRAGIKAGNTIKFSLNERAEFSIQEIIDSIDLTQTFKDSELTDMDMEIYIREFLGNEVWIVGNKIIPILPGNSITCVINNGKKDKTITLTVPQKNTK